MTIFQLIADPSFRHKFVLQKIIGHLRSWTREDLVLHYDDILSEADFREIQTLYNRYAVDNEPLEYILGYVEYGGLRFTVTPDTLIPRPETEYMIEAVREWFEQSSSSSLGLIDVGTGSGVLGLSTLVSFDPRITSAMLVDISQGALKVAQHNYNHFVEQGLISSARSTIFALSDLLAVPLATGMMTEVADIVILANLPYIPDETFDTNPDRTIHHEPRVAFVGGNDGVHLYRQMFAQLREYGQTQSLPTITMFLEMMTWQVDILRQEFDWLVFEEIKTFHFQIRIVKVTIKV